MGSLNSQRRTSSTLTLLLAFLGFFAGKGCTCGGGCGVCCVGGSGCGVGSGGGGCGLVAGGGGCSAAAGGGGSGGGCGAASGSSSGGCGHPATQSGGRLGGFAHAGDAGTTHDAACGTDATTVVCDSGFDAADVSDSTNPRRCPVGADRIVLLSDERTPTAPNAAPHLWTFDPTTMALSMSGPVACDPDPAAVLALAVDLVGNAWIAVDRGGMRELWEVSSLDGSCLGTLPISGADAPASGEALSMTFEPNPVGPFFPDILLGAVQPSMGPDRLVTIDPFSAMTTLVSPFSPTPGATRLFLETLSDGSLMSFDVSPMSTGNTDVALERRSPLSGASTVIAVSTVADTRNVAGAVLWNEDVWIFLAGTTTAPTSPLIRFRTGPRLTEVALPTIGFIPLAAATSTCAPSAPPM